MYESCGKEHFGRSRIVEALASVRQEWQEAAESESLTEIEGSVGLLLLDVVTAMGLSPAECVVALGVELLCEAESLADSAVPQLATVDNCWVQVF